jgi:hypothetical protein
MRIMAKATKSQASKPCTYRGGKKLALFSIEEHVLGGCRVRRQVGGSAIRKLSVVTDPRHR